MVGNLAGQDRRMSMETGTSWTYARRLFGTSMVVLGAFLLGEHLYRFGFEWWDVIGHEWLGLVLIIGGVLLAMRWQRTTESEDKV
jgi:hypothetical protein